MPYVFYVTAWPWFAPRGARLHGRRGSAYNGGPMSSKPAKRRAEYDVIEPIGDRVVVRKDENKRETRSGIVLPDSHEIPVITGRVIAISKAIENDDDQTIRQYDKVLFDPREAIPVELEHDNRLFVVHIDRVLAIFRRSEAATGGGRPTRRNGSGDGGEPGDPEDV
jgi:chaperonin GroES